MAFLPLSTRPSPGLPSPPRSIRAGQREPCLCRELVCTHVRRCREQAVVLTRPIAGPCNGGLHSPIESSEDAIVAGVYFQMELNESSAPECVNFDPGSQVLARGTRALRCEIYISEDRMPPHDLLTATQIVESEIR